MSPDTIQHPVLGTLARRGSVFVGEVEAPALDIFKYDTSYPNAPGPNGKYDVVIALEGDAAVPSQAALDLAAGLLSDPKQLAEQLADAMWDDVTGAGPDSGMWWHDNLNTVANYLEEDGFTRPANAAELAQHLRLSSIYFDQMFEASWIALLSFWCRFEEEHDLGVAMNRERVIGIGYGGGDLTLFDKV